MLKAFKISCFTMEGPHRINKDVWLFPAHVCSVERSRGITIIETATNFYYTTILVDIILKGLKDVDKLNNQLVQLN